MKQVAVLIGAGSIGQAIVRRVAAGKHVVLADYSEQNAATAAKTLEDAGFECSTLRVDLGSKDDILTLVKEAQKYGEVTNLINAAGVSPSQASVEEILRVDMVGTAILLEEFGKVMAESLPELKATQRTARRSSVSRPTILVTLSRRRGDRLPWTISTGISLTLQRNYLPTLTGLSPTSAIR